jgi:hypothetical protein
VEHSAQQAPRTRHAAAPGCLVSALRMISPHGQVSGSGRTCDIYRFASEAVSIFTVSLHATSAAASLQNVSSNMAVLQPRVSQSGRLLAIGCITLSCAVLVSATRDVHHEGGEDVRCRLRVARLISCMMSPHSRPPDDEFCVGWRASDGVTPAIHRCDLLQDMGRWRWSLDSCRDVESISWNPLPTAF